MFLQQRRRRCCRQYGFRNIRCLPAVRRRCRQFLRSHGRSHDHDPQSAHKSEQLTRMPLETEPPRSPERCPQLMEDPVHRFGPYHRGENLTITLSRFTIGEVVEPRFRSKTLYHGSLYLVNNPLRRSLMRSELLDQKERGDHLSSLIPNRPRGLFTTTASRRRAKMPCLSQPESSRLTVNSVVAVICANSSRERLISSAPSTLRPTCGSNRTSSRARRGATLSVDISRNRPSSICKRCARIRIVLRCRKGNRSDRASNVGAFQTSALHVRRASAVEQCLPRCADPTDPTILPGPSSRRM